MYTVHTQWTKQKMTVNSAVFFPKQKQTDGSSNPLDFFADKILKVVSLSLQIATTKALLVYR